MKTISISAILVPFLNIESLIHKTDNSLKSLLQLVFYDQFVLVLPKIYILNVMQKYDS